MVAAHGFIPVGTIVSADSFCRVNKDDYYYYVKITLRSIVTANSIAERNAQYGSHIRLWVQGLILRGNESSEVNLGSINCYSCNEEKIQMLLFVFFL